MSLESWSGFSKPAPHKLRELRRNLHADADGLCTYCWAETPLNAGTVDHWLPKALGGTWVRSNLRWCCAGCNGLKADMHPNEWTAWLTQLRQKQPRIETKRQRRIRLLAMCAPRGAGMRGRHDA